MTDADWLALCIYHEAMLEPADGKAAVARVVLNRTAMRYKSDGTIGGTVSAHNQFSWCEWDFVAGRYVRVAATPAAEMARVVRLLAAAKAIPAAWAECSRVGAAVQAGGWKGGAAYALLTADTVLYDNLALAQPAWAKASIRVTQIGHHTFFRDPAHLLAGAGR